MSVKPGVNPHGLCVANSFAPKHTNYVPGEVFKGRMSPCSYVDGQHRGTYGRVIPSPTLGCFSIFNSIKAGANHRPQPPADMAGESPKEGRSMTKRYATRLTTIEAPQCAKQEG